MPIVTATLAIKLVLTPLLVGAASLAARRWGSQLAGWLAGFPFTSAPVALILTLEHGTRFTAAAAEATILGVVSQAVFAFAYVWCARRLPWAACFGVATAGFAACTALFAQVHTPALVDAALAALGLLAALWWLPATGREARGVAPPAWDLPARMVVATAFVLVITGLAAALGPTLTGLVTPFPLYASVMGVFAHLHEGPASGAAVMRGLLYGLFGFGAFFLALSLLIVPAGAAVAFTVAAMAVVSVQVAALRLARVE